MSVVSVPQYHKTCDLYMIGNIAQEAKEVLKEVSVLVNKLESRPRHCKDLLDSGDTGSGLRLVYPYPGPPHHHVTVFCDHTVDGGGWTVLQRRTNDSIRQDFYRTWIEYQLGFGDLRYTGDAGDAMQSHNGVRFTTLDQDNDTYGVNCAVKFRGAWWYKACHSANLNGYQHQGNHSSYADGINWNEWHGYHYSLRRTSMMIRPAF
ncbi:Techylectin-5A [Chionoecetes opilio]|uniref:Techylectin-5A n=1 Tax=Chionoecetes opilio TaxID=41210 RepID=A0A8J4YBF8_CHIOP|nr:Techylectin-5A [Chionoecetes opilio]